MSSSIHVHFGVDGPSDATEKPPQQNTHRSFTIAGNAQSFWRTLPEDDDLMKCLAYRRMVYEKIGSERGSVSTVSSMDMQNGGRRKSEMVAGKSSF